MLIIIAPRPRRNRKVHACQHCRFVVYYIIENHKGGNRLNEALIRTKRVLGAEAMEKLAKARVAIFGLGGVGGYVLEALARSGVGQLDLIDNDTVALSNLNRQILATLDTVGMDKVDAAEARVKSINPGCVVRKYKCFYLPETKDQFDFTQYDYVVDAIDTVAGKLSLIQQAREAGTPILCAMGTGNKRDPSLLRLCDLYETANDALARVMRKECRRRGIDRLKVVYSPEEPDCRGPEISEPDSQRRSIPGSTAFVPPAAGLLIASEVVRALIS